MDYNKMKGFKSRTCVYICFEFLVGEGATCPTPLLSDDEVEFAFL